MSSESEAGQPGDAQLPGTLTEALYAQLVAFRRDLHMHPEPRQPGVPYDGCDQGAA